MSGYEMEPDLAREPWVRCAEPAEHEPHWHTVRAGNITFAGGMCDGKAKATEGGAS